MAIDPKKISALVGGKPATHYDRRVLTQRAQQLAQSIMRARLAMKTARGAELKELDASIKKWQTEHKSILSKIGD